MLESLDVRDGHAVLEIGTGTGYNAALLSHRLGSAVVTTVEVDPEVSAQAEKAPLQCGYAATVAVADGPGGYPAGAPYDRILATCSVPAIPAAWIAQTRTGGMILASLYRDLGGGPMRLGWLLDDVAAPATGADNASCHRLWSPSSWVVQVVFV